jgi:hypothetical protein
VSTSRSSAACAPPNTPLQFVQIAQIAPVGELTAANCANCTGTFCPNDASQAGPTANGLTVDPAATSTEAFEERVAIIEYEAGVPRPWAEGFAALHVASRPAGISPSEWWEVLDDGGRFLDRWAATAARLGWSVTDVSASTPWLPPRATTVWAWFP